MKKIILASASPRRKELLEQIGLAFDIIPSDIDEEIEARTSPEQYACTLSRSKAIDVAGHLAKGALVIGADTIVILGDSILGKPESRDDAFLMLKSLQGNWHEVITGITVVDTTDNKVVSDCEKTRVKMRQLSDDMIHAYIKTGEPMDKAGAYGIQKFGSLLVERIEGCYYNVVGLSLVRLGLIFEEFGFKLLK